MFFAKCVVLIDLWKQTALWPPPGFLACWRSSVSQWILCRQPLNASNSPYRQYYLQGVSVATDGHARDSVRHRLICSEHIRSLSAILRDIVDDRFGHLYSPISTHDAYVHIEDILVEENKIYRKIKQDLLLKFAANIYMHECTLGVLASDMNKISYYDMLYKAARNNLPDILGEDYYSLRTTEINIMCQVSNRYISWFCLSLKYLAGKSRRRLLLGGIQSTTLQARILESVSCTLAHFYCSCKSIFSNQTWSAACKRLFGDAGYSEGARRQQPSDTMSEMTLIIWSFTMLCTAQCHNLVSF